MDNEINIHLSKKTLNKIKLLNETTNNDKNYQAILNYANELVYYYNINLNDTPMPRPVISLLIVTKTTFLITKYNL